MVYTTRLASATKSGTSQHSLLVQVGSVAPAFVVPHEPSSWTPKYRSSSDAPVRCAPASDMIQSACGVVVGCSHAGVWQVAVLSVLRYTPPSEARITGQASFAACVSKTRSPRSSCAPRVLVNGPAHGGAGAP